MTNHLETVARKDFKQAEITRQISVLINWAERTDIIKQTTTVTTTNTNAINNTNTVIIIMIMLLTD